MDNPTIKPMVAPFKKFCMSIGALPSSYKDSLDYYETLLWLIKYLEDTIIPVVNNNGEAVTELQNLYIELKNYVEHYFDNLDVQEQIDNILDRIVEIDNILDRIVEDEEVTQEQIDNILNRMVEYEELTQAQLDETNNQVAKAKMVYNALPKVSDEGDNLTLDGTANCPMKMELKGNTEQNGTPTPDSPINVRVVTGNNSVKVVGRNLFDKNLLLDTSNYTRESQYFYYYKLDNKFKTNITVSMSLIGTNQNLVFGFTNQTLNFYGGYRLLDNGTLNTPITFNFTNATDVYFFVGNANNINIERDTQLIYNNYNIQIEKGSTATTYEPYHNQTYPINLGTIELCKIRDYQDYIYKDSGKWYKHSEICKVVLDGSNYPLYGAGGSSTDYWEYSRTGMTGGIGTQDSVKTNYFNQTTNSRIVILSDGGLYFRFPKSSGIDVSTYTLLNTWLSTHNTIVYYVLATPTNTEITDTTLISQLNAIENAVSYDTQTNIVQENYSEPFIINAECVRSLKDIFELIGNS